MTALLEVSPARSTEPLPPARNRGRSWSGWLLVVGMAGLTAAVRLQGLAQGPAYRDDEGTYVAQAWAVRHLGSLAHYTYWYDHPPLGWLVIAVWRWLTEPFLHPATEVLAGRQLMVVLAAADAALLLTIARRLGLRWWAGATAALLWALSPLAVGFSRSVWLDDVAITFALGSLACALTPKRHLWAFAMSGVLLGCAVLSKETTLLLAPAAVLAVARTSAGRTRPFCMAAFSAAAVLVLLAFPLLAVLKGELIPGPGHVSLLDAVNWQLHGRASTGSALDPTSASANIVGQWLHRDPWLLGGGVLAAPLVLLARRLQVASLALLVPVVVALRPGYLPEPFVVMLLPFCALVLGGVLDVALPRRLPALGPVLGAALVATLLMTSWLPGLRTLRSDDATRRTVAVEDWVAAHVPHDQRILVDDSLWVDLVNRGFDARQGVIWFYKTDIAGGLDPSVRKALPGGYRDIQWVVLSPILRDALEASPTAFTGLRRTLTTSTPVHTSGSGDDRYVVLRLQP